jgi:hypothetical protein
LLKIRLQACLVDIVPINYEKYIKHKDMAEKKSKLVEIKTKETTASVDDFINTIQDEQKRLDSLHIIKLMTESIGEEPKMWGATLIGFGIKRYKSPKTGREVDWFQMGFSPRKANLSLHMGLDIQRFSDQLKILGKHKTGAGCLYINKLADIDLKVLTQMIKAAVKEEENHGDTTIGR